VLTNTFVYPKDDGVTPNDSKGHGADNDPNNFQNFPVLTSVVRVPGGVEVSGTFAARRQTEHHLQHDPGDGRGPLPPADGRRA
jgi:hypothetical protein